MTSSQEAGSQEAGAAVPATPEDVKRSSAHLRGELSSELADGGDRFSADSTVLLKFHGIYQQDDRDQRRARTQARQDLAYSCMVRTRVPGGVLTADQWLALDAAGRRGRRRGAAHHHPPGHPVPRRASRATCRHLVGDAQPPPRHAPWRPAATSCATSSCCPAPHDDRRQDALLAHARHLAARFRPQTGAYYEVWLDGEQAVTASPAPDAGRGALLRRRLPAPEVQDRPGLAGRQLHRRLHPGRRHRAGGPRTARRASWCWSAAASA